MGKKSAAGLLTSVDSIFTTQEERDNAQRSYVTDHCQKYAADFQPGVNLTLDIPHRPHQL